MIEAEEKEAEAQAKASQEAALREAEAGRKLPGRKPKDPVARLARAQADYAACLTAAKTKRSAAADHSKAPDLEQDRAVKQAKAALAAAQQAADEHEPAKAPKANITDPDSRIMKTRKGYLQGYNGQAIVNRHQIVLACAVTQDANDIEQYEPMLEGLECNLNSAGIPQQQAGLMLADAGYCSEANLTAEGPERLIATLKDWKQRRAARELGTTSGEPPADATPIEAMEHRLRTEEGAAAYKQRSQLIEPVFGDRKHNRSYRSFRRRGLQAVQSEWALMHLAGNLLKLYGHQRAPNATVA